MLGILSSQTAGAGEQGHTLWAMVHARVEVQGRGSAVGPWSKATGRRSWGCPWGSQVLTSALGSCCCFLINHQALADEHHINCYNLTSQAIQWEVEATSLLGPPSSICPAFIVFILCNVIYYFLSWMLPPSLNLFVLLWAAIPYFLATGFFVFLVYFGY